MEPLSVAIDNLYYSTIEHKIARYFDLGMINSSNLPVEMTEDDDDMYYLDGTNKRGDFHIKITKQADGKYWIFVSSYNLKKVR